MSLEALTAALGLKLATLMGGFFGALVSLRFFPELTTWWQRATTLASGCLCAAYVSPVAGRALDLADRHEGGIAFLIGVLGMAVISNVIKAMPEWMTAARERFLGGGK